MAHGSTMRRVLKTVLVPVTHAVCYNPDAGQVVLACPVFPALNKFGGNPFVPELLKYHESCGAGIVLQELFCAFV